MQLARTVTVVTLVAAVAAGVAIAGMPDDPPGRINTGRLVPSDLMPATIADTTTTTAVVDTTAASTTTSTTSTTSSVPVVIDGRDTFVIVVANGTGVESVAGNFRDRIRPLGYTQVYPTATKQLAVGSTIYHLPGFADEALRLAAEVGFQPTQVVEVATKADAPAYWLSRDFQILVVIGNEA